MAATLSNYQARMLRVLDYIDDHLDGDLNLETVSGVAAFSKFHFHRQFTGTFGVPVSRYIQLARMRRAAEQLGSKESVTEVAMDAGYEAPDAFARAFRQRLGQSPSAFRKSPDWGPWLSAFGPLDNARNKIMQIVFDTTDVAVRDVPPTPVAIIEHRGNRNTLRETIETFRTWGKAAGLSPEKGSTFMVFRSQREPANPDDYSLDICAEVDMPIEEGDGRVRAGEIPGGRCAVLRYPGNTNNLEPAALFLYRDWLPTSGEEVRDFPIYSRRRLAAIPGVPAHEVVVELFLPLK